MKFTLVLLLTMTCFWGSCFAQKGELKFVAESRYDQYLTIDYGDSGKKPDTLLNLDGMPELLSEWVQGVDSFAIIYVKRYRDRDFFNYRSYHKDTTTTTTRYRSESVELFSPVKWRGSIKVDQEYWDSFMLFGQKAKISNGCIVGFRKDFKLVSFYQVQFLEKIPGSDDYQLRTVDVRYDLMKKAPHKTIKD